jgi:hypothetical protein
MDDINFFEATSVPLPGGGDTHFHPWDDGTAFTVTTRLPDGIVEHDDFLLPNLEHI